MVKKKKKDNTDKYRCFKIPISNILRKDTDTDIAQRNMKILEDAILRANKITSKSYLLLRLWVLHKYHNNIDIPVITKDTISMAMKSIMIPSRGQKGTCQKCQEILFNHGIKRIKYTDYINGQSVLCELKKCD